MKKRVFGKELFYILHLLLIIIFILGVFSIYVLSKSQFLSNKITIVVLFGIIGYILLELFIWLLIWRPYKKAGLLQTKALTYFDEMLDKESIIKASTKQAELLALQNQINPHFLYNTLEAIRGDALVEGVESIANTAEALSTFFRYTITETKYLVTLSDELANVDNYFTIQRYRFGEKLKLEISLPADESAILSKRLPKLTLQPIIENAIFHGLEGRDTGGTINILVKQTAKKILLIVSDNGVGMSESKVSEINRKLEQISVSTVSENKRGGIALINVCSRIKLLFGEDYGLHLFSIEGVGTQVHITIPIVWE